MITVIKENNNEPGYCRTSDLERIARNHMQQEAQIEGHNGMENQ